MAELSKEFEAYMIQHHYGAVALENSAREWSPQTLEAKINGERVTLSLDTCYKTTLSAECAQRLGLTVADTGEASVLVNRTYAQHDGIALIKSFTLDGCEINRTSTIIVLPKAVPFRRCDGEMGLDYLKLNAAIIPVGGTGFLIKPGSARVVSVRSFLTRLGYKPFSLTATPKVMLLECHINGRPIQMAIDTGSMFSIVDQASVMDILRPIFPEKLLLAQGGKNPPTPVFLFTPNEFDLDGFKVPPLEMRATGSPILKKGAIEGLLGQDFLSLHHGIIDLGEDLLWLK